VIMIPRATVAKALGTSADTLPPGDLPLPRLAELYTSWLVEAAQEREDQHLIWTFTLVDWLVAHDPGLAFDAVLTTLDLCTEPEQVAVLAAGPMEDLIHNHGATMIDRIVVAAEAPRVQYMLSGVWEGDTPALLWARIDAARRNGPSMDKGDPFPTAVGS